MRELEQQEASTGTSVVVRLCQYLSRSGDTPQAFLDSGSVDAFGLRAALDAVGIEVSQESATQAMAALGIEGGAKKALGAPAQDNGSVEEASEAADADDEAA